MLSREEKLKRRREYAKQPHIRAADAARKRELRRKDMAWHDHEKDVRRSNYRRIMEVNGDAATRIKRHSYETKKKHYKKNYAKLRHWNNHWLAVAKDLRGNMCTWCGNTDPRVLQFDHRDPDEKSACISRITMSMTENQTQHKWRRYISEINRCRLLCANCHYLRTYHGLAIVERKIDTVVYSDE